MINDYLSQKIVDAVSVKRIRLSYFVAVTMLNERYTIGMTTPGGIRFEFDKKTILEKLDQVQDLIKDDLMAILDHEEGSIRFLPANNIVKITIYTKYFGFKIPTDWSKVQKEEFLIKLKEVINS
jgi:hypothetical protein